MINRNKTTEFLLTSAKIVEILDDMDRKIDDLINLCYDEGLNLDKIIFYNQKIRFSYVQSEVRTISKLIFAIEAVEEGKTKDYILNSLHNIIGNEFEYNLNDAINFCEISIEENIKRGKELFASIFENQKEVLEFIYMECEKLGIFE